MDVVSGWSHSTVQTQRTWRWRVPLNRSLRGAFAAALKKWARFWNYVSFDVDVAQRRPVISSLDFSAKPELINQTLTRHSLKYLENKPISSECSRTEDRQLKRRLRDSETTSDVTSWWRVQWSMDHVTWTQTAIYNVLIKLPTVNIDIHVYSLQRVKGYFWGCKPNKMMMSPCLISM